MEVISVENCKSLECMKGEKEWIEEMFGILKQLPKEFQMRIITVGMFGALGLGFYALKQGYSFSMDENGKFLINNSKVSKCIECM